MSYTHIASAVLPSLKAARSVRERLSRAGFARNSIDIERHGDEFEVLIHVSEEHRDRAERILTGSPLGEGLRQASERTLDTFHDNRPLALGLAVLAGFALFGLTNRR